MITSILEYEFIVVYKVGCTYVMVDALFKLLNTIDSISVPD